MAGESRGDFAGRVAWVTGAASGIGRATALAFAREGASVACVDVAAGGNEETAGMIERLGGRALALRCDVSQPGEVRAALEAVGAFGRLDAAFNNAGIEHPMAALAEIGEETWERVIGINLRGMFLCMKYEIPRMLAQGGGAIVNMSSIDWRGAPSGFAARPA
jgi:NAD(P)-dependent dehydrogenase (short-subunit alcohol dehydrogenase family)